MIDKDTITLIEAKLPFWEKLNQFEKDIIISNTYVRKIAQGKSLYQSDNNCLGLVIVLSGGIRTYITSKDGKEVTLYRLKKHDICILSASCILDSIDFDIYIDAEIDTTVIQMSSAILAKIASSNIYVELFTYKLATERFSDVMWSMQQILFMSFDKRLASFLLDESVRTHSNDIHMTHEQIAKHLGSAREVVSRMLNYFSKEGFVKLSRGNIHIINKDALYRLR